MKLFRAQLALNIPGDAYWHNGSTPLPQRGKIPPDFTPGKVALIRFKACSCLYGKSYLSTPTQKLYRFYWNWWWRANFSCFFVHTL